MTKQDILNKRPCKINDIQFIKQVKKGARYVSNNTAPQKYKLLLRKHTLFEKGNSKGIKADQTYISRIVHIYYKNPKISGDLMCGVIGKVHQAYSSFFSLRKKGNKANVPKYLDRNGSYILPFFAKSKKEMKIGGNDYYRLTVGSRFSDNFINIVDDHRLVCIYKSIQNNLYVDKKYLLKIKPNDKIFRKDNYIVNGFYISKDSKHIIEGSYIYVMKPPLLNKKTLKMIEITP